jgi:hypothetical protein
VIADWASRTTTKVVVGLVLGVLSAAACAVLWQHYSGLIDAKVALTKQVKGLEDDVTREKARADAFEQANKRWSDASRAQAQALRDLEQAQRDAAKHSKELKDVLSQHDLGALAARKPGLIEDRINAGTARTLRVLERATEGSAAAPGGAAAVPNSP